MTKETTLKATITEFVWTNPHVEIGIAPVDGKGSRWLLELGSPVSGTWPFPLGQSLRPAQGEIPLTPSALQRASVSGAISPAAGWNSHSAVNNAASRRRSKEQSK